MEWNLSKNGERGTGTEKGRQGSQVSAIFKKRLLLKFLCFSLFIRQIWQNFATFLNVWLTKPTKQIKFAMSKYTKTHVWKCENKKNFQGYNPLKIFLIFTLPYVSFSVFWHSKFDSFCGCFVSHIYFQKSSEILPNLPNKKAEAKKLQQ